MTPAPPRAARRRTTIYLVFSWDGVWGEGTPLYVTEFWDGFAALACGDYYSAQAVDVPGSGGVERGSGVRTGDGWTAGG